MREYDAIFIGAGQAGPFLAARMAAMGRKVAAWAIWRLLRMGTPTVHPRDGAQCQKPSEPSTLA